MIFYLFYADPALAELAGLAATRLLAAAVMLWMLSALGLSGSLIPRGKKFAIPAFFALLIALNNLPFIGLLSGMVGVDAAWWEIFLLASECFAVALFEETSFRGIELFLFWEKFQGRRRGRFWAVAAQAALFGGIHVLNLFAGAGAGSVSVQVLYSFGIGAMLGVVMAEGGSVPLTAAIHGIYNFCGLLVPTLGYGDFWDIWNWPTVVITAALAVFVAGLFLWRLLKKEAPFPPELRVPPASI